MNKSISITIAYTYIFSVFLLLLTFKNELTVFILLQNTIFFLYISYLIFRKFIGSGLEIFSLASKITYFRLSISIIILIAAINSNVNSNIFDIFYVGKIIIILSTVSLVMDGLDGFIARKYNLVSKFGEIIDQESDNFLMLVISISLYLNKDVGLYVFLIPLYRYTFLVSMKKYDWLQRTLPSSQFRKIACVLTIALMIMSQDVYFNYENTLFLVILSLFIITFSFSKDIIWLYRNKNAKT